MNNNYYKVAFFTLVGIILLVCIIVLINNKELFSKNKRSNDNYNYTEEESIDDKVINFLSDKKDQISKTFTKENAKELFVTTVDFLFYDGEINGYKLSDLTEEGKLEVNKLANLIQINIEKTFPGLIDDTKYKYSDIKNSIMDSYTNIINSYCKNKETNCEKIRDTYNSINSNFKSTFDIVKEKVNTGKEKLDKWYKDYKN